MEKLKGKYELSEFYSKKGDGLLLGISADNQELRIVEHLQGNNREAFCHIDYIDSQFIAFRKDNSNYIMDYKKGELLYHKCFSRGLPFRINGVGNWGFSYKDHNFNRLKDFAGNELLLPHENCQTISENIALVKNTVDGSRSIFDVVKQKKILSRDYDYISISPDNRYALLITHDDDGENRRSKSILYELACRKELKSFDCFARFVGNGITYLNVGSKILSLPDLSELYDYSKKAKQYIDIYKHYLILKRKTIDLNTGKKIGNNEKNNLWGEYEKNFLDTTSNRVNEGYYGEYTTPDKINEVKQYVKDYSIGADTNYSALLDIGLIAKKDTYVGHIRVGNCDIVINASEESEYLAKKEALLTTIFKHRDTYLEDERRGLKLEFEGKMGGLKAEAYKGYQRSRN